MRSPVQQPSLSRPPRTTHDRGWPPYLACAAGAVTVLTVSRLIPAARQGYPSDLPPLLVRWQPLLGPGIVLPLALAVAAAYLIPGLSRVRSTHLLVILVLFAWAFSVTLAVQGGRAQSFEGCCEEGGVASILTFPLTRGSDYYANVALIDRVGPKRVVSQYQYLARPAKHRLSLHATTHPPGAVLLLWAVAKLTGHTVLAVALVIVLVGALGVIPAYALAKELYGEDVARAAAILLATAPGILLYSATSVDVVFMTVFAAALAASARAPRSAAWSVVAGGAATVAATFTWGSAALLPLTLGIFVLRRDLGIRALARRAGAWVLGAAAVTLALWAGLGMNLLAIYHANIHAQFDYATIHRSYGYWAAGNLLGFLITAGVLVVALYATTLRTAWSERRLGFETMLLAVLVLWSVFGFYRGETDHNWLLFIPPFVTVAAASRIAPRTAAVGGMAQSALTQVLFFTNW